MWVPGQKAIVQLGLTKLVDANLLQLLPGEVGYQPHGVVAAAQQLLVVLRQPQCAQPLQQVRLEEHCRWFEWAPHPAPTPTREGTTATAEGGTPSQLPTHRDVVGQPFCDAELGDL